MNKLDHLTNRITDSVRERDDKIKKLESKVAVLELEADKVEQYSRRANLRFSGILETGETPENTTEKILQTINKDMCPDVPVCTSQIKRSHLLGPKVDRNEKPRQRNIIIRFTSENVYRAKFNLTNRNMDGHRKVFVNEDLTSTRGAEEGRSHSELLDSSRENYDRRQKWTGCEHYYRH